MGKGKVCHGKNGPGKKWTPGPIFSGKNDPGGHFSLNNVDLSRKKWTGARSTFNSRGKSGPDV